MVTPTGECWCGCGAACNSFFYSGHDGRALHGALEALGYPRHNMTAELLEANSFQPGGDRSAELRAVIARRWP